MGKMVLIFVLLAASVVPAWSTELHISAAASLKESLNELTELFPKRHPSVSFRTNFGASGTLAKQIEAGAPADLFISANREWVDYLIGKRLANPASAGVFAYNQLVVVGRPDLHISAMKDLVALHRIAIGSPKSVPAGEYAMEAFKKAGIDRQIAARLVQARDVRACLQYADQGEVDAALVYRTDALLLSKRAKILYVVPEGLHERVSYPLVLTAEGSQKPDAQAFVKFLTSPEAKAILKKRGFEVH